MPGEGALSPLIPGKLLTIGQGPLLVSIAPAAGGRIAQIKHNDIDWLVGHDSDNAAMIAWGCYPMLPWAGRIRHGRFEFEGRTCHLPTNFAGHAIHGVGFALPWQVEAQSSAHVELSLRLPNNQDWPFGGRARQRIGVVGNSLRMELSVLAGQHAMPVVFGWHPWFRKPECVDFKPSSFYPRDAEGIATLPLTAPPPPPWDDCFINREPVIVRRAGQQLRLTSNCDHWVVYDEPAHATCVEPQSGPPDAFNLGSGKYLAPHTCDTAWFLMEWL